MAKFSALKPEEVIVGRGRGAAEARLPYIEALRDGEAGKIELERGEKAQTAKRLLQSASKEIGVRVRSSIVGNEIFWKVVGSK